MKHILAFLTLLALPLAAQEKVSERETLTGAQVAGTTDWIGISDMSAAKSKKISPAELWNYFKANTSFTGTTTVASLYATDVSTTSFAAVGSVTVPDGSFSIAKTTGLQTALDGKQATLVSGTNIKTVNGTSLLGSGDVTVTGGTWGSITGTLSSQTDLNSALAAKAASGANTDITSLKVGVVVMKSTGLMNFYPPSADTDAARFTAFTTANATLSSGDTLITSPGNYLVSAAVTLVANVKYEFGKSRFYLSSGVSSVYYFTINNADDVTISGGLFDGASVNVGYGCFNVAGTSRRTRILHSRFLNWPQGSADTGVLTMQAASVVTYKHQSALISGCFFEGNYRSIMGNMEFVTVENCSFSGDGRSIELYGPGNWNIANSNVCATSTWGLRVRDGSNDSHTIVTGCKFAHNSGKSVQVDVGATNGVVFSGCQFYSDNSTSGYVDISGAGVNFIGGILDAPLSNTSTVAGRGSMLNMFVPGFFATMGWTGANRMQFTISGCHTPTGQWSNNDLQTYSYADNSAATTAGLEAGRQYKTSTGEVRVVY